MPRNAKTGQFGTVSAKFRAIRGASALNKFQKGIIRRQPAISPSIGLSRLQSSPAPAETWKVGRRIVELQTLADQLDCGNCSSPLSLKNIVRETRHGFGSILYVSCGHCDGEPTKVYTGKRHAPSTTKKTVFDVNSKAALGKYHRI